MVLETELFSIISQYGFPIAVSGYLLLTRDKIIQKNTEAINKLVDLISLQMKK